MIYLRNNKPTEVKIHYKSHGEFPLFSSSGFVVFPPKGTSFVLAYAYYFNNNKDPELVQFINHCIFMDLGVVVICNKLPQNPIIDEHVVYIETENRWFTPFLIKNTEFFSAVWYNGHKDAKRYALLFARSFSPSTLIIDNFKKLKQLKSKVTKWNSERSILIHTEDGLGDVLMTLPTAKTYKERGYKVYYVVNPVMSSIFNNLDFVDKVYTRLDYSPIKLVTYFFETTHKLSDYGKDWNQQNRIYSTAFLCGLAPKELVIQKPIIVLSKEEKNFASSLLKGFKNTVAISWHAVGTNRTYPYKNVLQLIDLLKDKGYFPIIVDTHVADFKNKCLDLTNKLNLRQYFAIINAVDYVITADTGTLHVAGAFNKRTIALFGPIKAEWRTSTYKNVISIQASVPCSPCMDGQFISPDKRLCKSQDNNYCMHQITPEMIIDKLNKLNKKTYEKNS